MRIAIDIRMISPTMHGISRYTYNLIKGLLDLDYNNKYFLIGNNRYIEQLISKQENVFFIITPFKLYGILEQIFIPGILKKYKIDIFHSPTYSAPIFQPCKVIMTIHDMIHMIFPGQHQKIHQYYFKNIVKPAANQARRIITVSECSKRDISSILKIPSKKIIVTYNATEDRFFQKTNKNVINKVLIKYKLTKRYILHIGNHKYHKNLNTLLDAFFLLKNNNLEQLLFISGRRNEKLLKRVGKYNNEIIFGGDINDDDLPIIYSQADICVVPSLYEGFGLPALEAMACGTPVIASKVSSLPEVIGNAGILIDDPHNINEFAENIKNVIIDNNLRNTLIVKGINRAKKFTWKHVAKKTLNIYKEIYNESKIGFNAQKYMSMNTGVGVYTNNISKTFLKVDKKNIFYNYSQKTKNNQTFSEEDYSETLNSSGLKIKNLIRILWEQFILPLKQFQNRVDLFHYPDHTLSLFIKLTPTIITVHDLAFLKFPELFNKSRFIYKRIAIKRSFKTANFIIAVSESTKQDVVKKFPFVKNKIEVVHLGVNKHFFPIKNLEPIRKKFNLPPKIILFLGTLEPRKNLVRLIQAFKKLKTLKNIEHRLVIAGTKGWLYNQIFEEVINLSLKNDVIFTGFISYQELPSLYSCADVFVYPSLYEGFGLPPLEAMACGTPVISSNSSSLPEVVGNGAIMINPYDIDELKDAIYSIISNKQLKAELSQRGIERAKNFTWEKTALKTIDIYKKVLSPG